MDTVKQTPLEGRPQMKTSKTATPAPRKATPEEIKANCIEAIVYQISEVRKDFDKARKELVERLTKEDDYAAYGVINGLENRTQGLLLLGHRVQKMNPEGLLAHFQNEETALDERVEILADRMKRLQEEATRQLVGGAYGTSEGGWSPRSTSMGHNLSMIEEANAWRHIHCIAGTVLRYVARYQNPEADV